MSFFQFLEQQISEECIVEDEVTLARLAMLVPTLCEALQQAVPVTPAAQEALARARSVIDEILAEEEHDYSQDGVAV